MNKPVYNMASLRERFARVAAKCFPLLWRLSLLLLPWQARWFHEASLIAGYSWEEGRNSLYLSWFVLLMTMIAALFLDEGLVLSKREQRRRRKLSVNGGLTLLVVFSLATTSVFRATLQWWMEVGMLYAFFRLLADRVAWREALSWFVIELIPEALLGISQALTQQVTSFKWLGIASQLPSTPGVAVIEVAGARWLRAYGGFPHPNILGGWLVVALILIQLRLRDLLLSKRVRIFYYLALILFSVALALTYSRSAWAGLVLATIMLFVAEWRRELAPHFTRRKWMALGIILVSFVVVFAWRPMLVYTRAAPETRLEQKSVNERVVGLQNVWRVLRVHPFIGSGVGGGAWMIGRMDQAEARPAVIPLLPHAVPLLALMELGVLGSALLVLTIHTSLAWPRRWWWHTSRTTRWMLLVVASMLLPPLLFDHYVWSYWSGKALFACVCFFVMCMQQETSVA